MIKTIRTKNIKGNTFAQELTGKDIFIGRNGAGKSTRLQALQLAMLGYIPGKGKTNQETFKLSSGTEMTAGLQLENFSFDRTIARSEKLKGDGSKEIKYGESLSVSPNKGEKNPTQMNARVTSEIGNFPVVFDFQEFLNLSDAKRREFIYGLSPITNDTWDKARVAAHLEKNILTIGLKSTNYDLYEATNELIIDALAEWPDDYDLTAGLQSMLSWVEGQQKHWNKKQTDAVGAVRELAEMKNQLEETDRDIVSTKNELQRLRDQYTDVHGQIMAGREIKRQWDEKQQRIVFLRSEIERLQALINTEQFRDYESEIAALQVKIKQTDIGAESENFQIQIDAARRLEATKTTELNEARTRLVKLDLELNTMNSVLKNIQDKGAGVCVLHHQISCDKDFSKFTGFVGEKGPSLQAQIDELNKLIQQLQSEIHKANEDAGALEASKRALHQAFVDEAKENERIRASIDYIRQAEQADLKSQHEAHSKINALHEELTRLSGENPPAFAPLEILEPQHAALEIRIKDLDLVFEEKEKAKTTLSNAQTAMISASKAQYYHTASKNLSAALGAKGIQGELVKGILGPVEESINENLRLMGIQNPCFFSTQSETGKEVFQFGWIKNGNETNFDVLSTGEQIMFLSAFLVTLLERSNPPLKVLALDNIENLDKGNFTGLLNGLNGLAHKLDNILIAGVVNSVQVEGWEVWDLSPKEETSIA